MRPALGPIARTLRSTSMWTARGRERAGRRVARAPGPRRFAGRRPGAALRPALRPRQRRRTRPLPRRRCMSMRPPTALSWLSTMASRARSTSPTQAASCQFKRRSLNLAGAPTSGSRRVEPLEAPPRLRLRRNPETMRSLQGSALPPAHNSGGRNRGFFAPEQGELSTGTGSTERYPTMAPESAVRPRDPCASRRASRGPLDPHHGDDQPTTRTEPTPGGRMEIPPLRSAGLSRP